MTQDGRDPAASIPRIRHLPPVVANQIAAGEVVERPASVAKELLENSLDAGARQLEVDAEEAGVRLLRVRDDGCGILRADLRLALDRHATSKLREPADLERVATLGFRGEALPSIASVSRLVLSSRPAGEAPGWQVRVDGGGETEGPTPVSHPPGTTVEVRDLFYNVPARRKFLRGPRTELGHLVEVARRIALARFDVALRLRHEGRELLAVRAALDEAGRVRRLAEVCGQAFLETALFVEAERAGLKLSGWVGLPEAARAQGDLQYLFLNGRPVRDRLLGHAVREAYQDRVYPGRHPAFVLYLELDPGQVDVNVHPTKQEVRFREARLVHDFLSRGIARAFAEPGLRGPAGGPFVPVPATGHGGPRAAGAEFLARQEAPAYAAAAGAAAPAAPPGEGGRPLGRALGLVQGRFLVAESARGLVLADARALVAQVTRARLRRALADGEVASRPLLLPVAVSVGSEEAEAAETGQPACQALGLDLARSGPTRVTLRRVPAPLQDLDPERVVRVALGALRSAPDGGRGATAQARLLEALAAEAGAGLAAGTGAATLDGLLRALEALGEGARPPGLWRELGGDEIQRLLGAAAAARDGEGP